MVKAVHENDPNVGDESDQEGLVDAFRMGRAMEEFVASNPAGAVIVNEARQQLQESINVWLRADDPTTPEARGAHFRARVATELLTVIENAISSGRAAEKLLSEQEASGQSR